MKIVELKEKFQEYLKNFKFTYDFYMYMVIVAIGIVSIFYQYKLFDCKPVEFNLIFMNYLMILTFVFIIEGILILIKYFKSGKKTLAIITTIDFAIYSIMALVSISKISVIQYFSNDEVKNLPIFTYAIFFLLMVLSLIVFYVLTIINKECRKAINITFLTMLLSITILPIIIYIIYSEPKAIIPITIFIGLIYYIGLFIIKKLKEYIINLKLRIQEEGLGVVILDILKQFVKLIFKFIKFTIIAPVGIFVGIMEVLFGTESERNSDNLKKNEHLKEIEELVKKKNEYLELADEEAGKGGGIIEELLTFDELELQKMDLHKKSANHYYEQARECEYKIEEIKMKYNID